MAKTVKSRKVERRPIFLGVGKGFPGFKLLRKSTFSHGFLKHHRHFLGIYRRVFKTVGRESIFPDFFFPKKKKLQKFVVYHFSEKPVSMDNHFLRTRSQLFFFRKAKGFLEHAGKIVF